MSVWVSRLIFDSLWPDETGPSPIQYRESHVIPTADDPRGGQVHTAHLPGFITRDGRDNGTPGDEDHPWWPFLRLSVDSGIPGEDTIILDVAQVDALIADLTAWRANAREETP
jgi:hypothetical protein